MYLLVLIRFTFSLLSAFFLILYSKLIYLTKKKENKTETKSKQQKIWK